MVVYNHLPRLLDTENKMVFNLTDGLVRSFRVGKVFNTDKISSMDFASNGQHLVSCIKDDKIIVYDCDKGTTACTITTKKYGVDLIRFMGANESAIHSSSKIDNTIRHLSLLNRDIRYTQYFPGHTNKVTSLCVSPDVKTFISASMDKTLRLWDIRSSACRGIMRLSGQPVAAYDPEGLIFSVGIDSQTIKLYDMRSYVKGPFSTFKLNAEQNCEWTDLKFSKNGKNILINTNGATIHSVDAFNGKLQRTFVGKFIEMFFIMLITKANQLSYVFRSFFLFRSFEHHKLSIRSIIQPRLEICFFRQQ